MHFHNMALVFYFVVMDMREILLFFVRPANFLMCNLHQIAIY